MRLSISEILDRASNMKTKKEKIDFLRGNDNSVLRNILRYAYDPSIKFLLPEGAPPYKRSEFVDGHGMLYSESRKLYLFVEGGNPNLTPLKREMLFINFLESLDPKDADLMINVKDKKIPYKGINKALIKETFPGLINE
jgi:hypothetical protein